MSQAKKQKAPNVPPLRLPRSPVSQEKWSFILDALVAAKLTTLVDPRQLTSCVSKIEMEMVTKQTTDALRAQKLVSYLRTRASSLDVLKEALKTHQPLLKEMSTAAEAWNQRLCEDECRLKAAFNCLHDYLDVVSEWAIPQLRSNGCLSSSEATDVTAKKVKLVDLLTDTKGPKERWSPFLTFLETEHPDILALVDNAFLSSSPSKQKAGQMEGDLRRLRSSCATLKEEKACLEARMETLKTSATKTFVLYNDATETEQHVSRISLPVADCTNAGDVRRAIAKRLNIPPASLFLSRHLSLHKGTELVDVEDEDGTSYAAGVVELDWEQAAHLAWLWPAFDDDDLIYDYPERSLVIRASFAPLRPFTILNEVAEFHDGQSFCLSLPLKDNGSVGELKAAVGRWMEYAPSSFMLSRRVGKCEGKDVVAVQSADKKWEGFADWKGQVKYEVTKIQEWKWVTPKDEEVFEVVPRHWNIIRVSMSLLG